MIKNQIDPGYYYSSQFRNQGNSVGIIEDEVRHL